MRQRYGGIMKKRILSLLGAAVLSISLLAGCARETDEKAADAESTPSEETEQKKLAEVTLNEVAHSIFYAPMYAAIEEGYFEEEGIDLTLVCGFGDNSLGKDIHDKMIQYPGAGAPGYCYALLNPDLELVDRRPCHAGITVIARRHLGVNLYWIICQVVQVRYSIHSLFVDVSIRRVIVYLDHIDIRIVPGESVVIVPCVISSYPSKPAVYHAVCAVLNRSL